MTFLELQQQMQQLLVLTDPYGVAMFNSLLPAIINDAEGRIYRDPELDFLFTRTTDDTQVTTPGNRSVPIPPQFVVVEGVSLIVPAPLLPTQAGARRVPLLRVTRAFLDLTWPTESMMAAPVPFETYFCIFSENEPTSGGEESDEAMAIPSSIKIAPTPDGEYHTEFIGTFRPAPLSAANQTTLLSTLYPELLLAAAMVFGCALLHNWSAQADDPRASLSWEAHFQAVKQVAIGESKRQKSQGAATTPSGPALSRPAMPQMPMPMGGGVMPPSG